MNPSIQHVTDLLINCLQRSETQLNKATPMAALGWNLFLCAFFWPIAVRCGHCFASLRAATLPFTLSMTHHRDATSFPSIFQVELRVKCFLCSLVAQLDRWRSCDLYSSKRRPSLLESRDERGREKSTRDSVTWAINPSSLLKIFRVALLSHANMRFGGGISRIHLTQNES